MLAGFVEKKILYILLSRIFGMIIIRYNRTMNGTLHGKQQHHYISKAAKKVLFLVARPLRPLAPPTPLSGPEEKHFFAASLKNDNSQLTCDTPRSSRGRGCRDRNPSPSWCTCRTCCRTCSTAYSGSAPSGSY